MTTCKIVGCKRLVYRVGMCPLHYDAWLTTGVLPGPVKQGRGAPQEEDQAWIKRSTHNRLRRVANALAECARPWAAHDEALRAALAAYEEARS